ncbi:MAG: response regulator [Candidatus Bathyarchaeota archaeon]|nr:response regulator [Candidatus Bathyarchaeota archaeon]
MSGDSILIVDDDEDILYFFKLILEDEGYYVETASTGYEAIEKAKAKKFNLALLDYIMHDIIGEQVAVQLSQIDKTTKIIFITGYSQIKDKLFPRELAIRDVLLKPITDEELLLAVKTVLPAPYMEVDVITVTDS